MSVRDKERSHCSPHICLVFKLNVPCVLKFVTFLQIALLTQVGYALLRQKIKSVMFLFRVGEIFVFVSWKYSFKTAGGSPFNLEGYSVEE